MTFEVGDRVKVIDEIPQDEMFLDYRAGKLAVITDVDPHSKRLSIQVMHDGTDSKVDYSWYDPSHLIHWPPDHIEEWKERLLND